LDATAQTLEIILTFHAKRMGDPEHIGLHKQELFQALSEKGFTREYLILSAFDAIFSGMTQPVHIDLRHATLTESNVLLQFHSIGASVQLLSQTSGSKPIAAALNALTEAIQTDKQLALKDRAEALEKLSFIAKQAALPAPQRYNTILESALKSIPPLFSSATALKNAWIQFGPDIVAFFQSQFGLY
jgi:hypothetical protein